MWWWRQQARRRRHGGGGAAAVAAAAGEGREGGYRLRRDESPAANKLGVVFASGREAPAAAQHHKPVAVGRLPAAAAATPFFPPLLTVCCRCWCCSFLLSHDTTWWVNDGKHLRGRRRHRTTATQCAPSAPSARRHSRYRQGTPTTRGKDLHIIESSFHSERQRHLCPSGGPTHDASQFRTARKVGAGSQQLVFLEAPGRQIS